MFFMNHAYLLIVIFALFTIEVNADSWDDFSNNLATDLAPFLSLFGEQLTKQYISESTNVLDYFIFAMAPMGILTAVVSAIRVRGSPALRAFIGRAQEGTGTAEAELCSSTSRDVCELYNSGGIARVFGRPRILEVVHDPTYDFSNPSDTTAGIYTFQEYMQGKGQEFWKGEGSEELPVLLVDAEKGRQKDKNTSTTPYTTTEAAPNLSLNIGIKKQRRVVFLAIAVLGLVLQLGILIFAGIVTYYLKWGKDGDEPESYACPLVVIGTFLVCGGIFHCAFLVGQSTEEKSWVRKADNAPQSSIMYWLQPGGQIIGDQTFDAFSYSDCDNRLSRYTTSRKRRFDSNESKFGIWVAIITTISGFVLQFTGLRGIHSAVSVAQLGVIMIMSMARAALRMQRLEPDDNCFSKILDEVVGHELDWLALRIGRNDIEKDTKESTESLLLKFSALYTSQGRLALPSKSDLNQPCRHLWRVCGAPKANQIVLQLPMTYNPQCAAAKILAYRIRLAALTNSDASFSAPARDFKTEMVKVRNESQQLAVLIEATINKLFLDTNVKDPWKNATSLFWGIDCAIYDHAFRSGRTDTVYLQLIRQDPEDPESAWVFKSTQALEGILGLWVWSMKTDPATETEDSLTGLKKYTAESVQTRRFISTDQTMGLGLKMWLGDDFNIAANAEYTLCNPSASPEDPSSLWIKTRKGNITPVEKSPSLPPKVRFFGAKATQISQNQERTRPFRLWSTEIKGSLVTCCAQEVYASFITSMIEIVDDLGPVQLQRTDSFKLKNSFVGEIVGLFTKMQLGTTQEALACIIPLVAPRLGVSLWEAARRGHDTLVKQLLESREVDPNKRNADGKTPLSNAAVYGYEAVVKQFLLSDKVDSNAKDNLGRTALLLAIQYGQETIAEQLLESPKVDANMSDNRGRTPLSWAAENGQKAVTKKLLQSQVDPDKGDSRGQSPLWYAVLNGHVDIVRQLLETSKVNADTMDNSGRTALLLAVQYGQQAVAEQLLQCPQVSVGVKDNDGRTSLSWAAESGQKAVVNQLLQSPDIKPDEEDSFKRTPLWYAVSKGHEDIVKQLLATKLVDPNAKDKDGQSPVERATWTGNEAVAKILEQPLNLN